LKMLVDCLTADLKVLRRQFRDVSRVGNHLVQDELPNFLPAGAHPCQFKARPLSIIGIWIVNLHKSIVNLMV